VHAEDLARRAVGALLGDDLDDTFGLANDLGATVAPKGSFFTTTS